ncbi:hypothetical protein PanWU01x14_012770 [Parasponia andersonii]|uniref:Uncharacterized protein n=1 Tax=Parasponia andersonii TaxID=3476 RepID=A0A2P5E0U9_PARAD|nr:hypothetical protein PanWU01x14_012770 [Parasponia andersonii]
MATIELSYHNGDRGANSPWCPTRIPQRYESDINVDPWYKNLKSILAEQKGKIIPVVEEFFEYKELNDDNNNLDNIKDCILRTVVIFDQCEDFADLWEGNDVADLYAACYFAVASQDSWWNYAPDSLGCFFPFNHPSLVDVVPLSRRRITVAHSNDDEDGGGGGSDR